MESRISFQQSVTKGQPKPLTKAIWDQLIDSPEVKSICDQIAALDPSTPDYNDRKQALKRRLPIIIPHAASFRNGKRISADAIPSGLAMLDVDHVDNPKEWFDSIAKQLLSDNRIYLVSITASGKGLRIIGERLSLSGAPGVSAEKTSSIGSDSIRQLESIEAAQLRMATALNITEYDAVTKDLARASYVVPRDYILYIDESGLFSSSIASGLNPDNGSPEPHPSAGSTLAAIPASEKSPRLALPPHVVPSSVSPEFNSGTSLPFREESEVGSLSYRGIPYADIIEQLMVATGNAGGAIVGERNTVYFSLSTYMRYITDFNADLLLRILPDFGLSEAERRSAIASAIGRPRKSQKPMVLQSAIAICEKEAHLDEQSPLEKSTALPLPELPRLLKLVCRRLPEDYRAAMIIASLPVLGTLATRIRFEYLDRQEQSLSFFSCITAPAASGKSFIRKPLDLLLTPINEQDAIEREKEQSYKEKLRASKNSKNQPEDPHACPRNNGVAISIAKLLQLLTYAEGKHLIGIGEEMDTLVKSERAGVWSQKSDIYRLAFDNAEYGQAYMSDSSFNAHIKVYYNLLLTGTPNSMKRFFKDLENGLATRVCFAQLPDTSFTEIPVFAPYTEAEKEEIIRWARRLDAEQGTLVCPQLNTVIANWLEAKRQQAIDADSHAMDTLRRRAGVIGFRAGMLCYLLENRKFTKTVGQFAEWVAEYVFRNQMELWGEQMEQELSGALEVLSGERGSAASLLALLPAEFSTADLIKLRARKGQSVKNNAICMVLNRWRTNHKIEQIGEAKYKKL